MLRCCCSHGFRFHKVTRNRGISNSVHKYVYMYDNIVLSWKDECTVYNIKYITLYIYAVVYIVYALPQLYLYLRWYKDKMQ